MRRVERGLLIGSLAACVGLSACGREVAIARRSGWERTALATNTDLRRPTPTTVGPPGTDSRQNGTASAGAIAPRQGAASGQGQGGGTSSTGGPG